MRFILVFIFTTNNDKENIYCECRGKIFMSINSSLQESLVFAFINSDYMFLDFENINTMGRITPENYTICHK